MRKTSGGFGVADIGTGTAFLRQGNGHHILGTGADQGIIAGKTRSLGLGVKGDMILLFHDHVGNLYLIRLYTHGNCADRQGRCQQQGAHSFHHVSFSFL